MSNDSTSDSNLVEQYRVLHEQNERFGAGSRHFDYVQMILNYCGFRQVIDFGCGKGVLADQVAQSGVAECARYDPAVKGVDMLPDREFDAVINTDVLEHVPESELAGVLSTFKALSQNAVIIPHLAKAREILPNGENAHCTIMSPEKWKALFQQHYGFVYSFSHSSPKHAIFLCTQAAVDVDFLGIALEQVSQGMPNPNAVNVMLDAPLMTRIKAAAKLLAGITGVRLVRRVFYFFRRL